MKKREIIIYDDEDRLRKGYVDKLSEMELVMKSFDVDEMETKKFLSELDELKNRQKNLRENAPLGDTSLKLDEASICIIDFELMNFLTSENVAYYIRCFSKCGLIVGLNLDRGNLFDLTLKGHPESFSDLNISSEQLTNPGLWGGETEGFRPWHWPVLPKYLDSFQKKIDDVTANLAKPICSSLGFPTEVVELFSRNASEFLGGTPHETNFTDFVEKSRNGLKGRDVEGVEKRHLEMIARIAAARISKWLERVVLPGQDILVDAPHLVWRYPSLLKGKRDKIESWNHTTKIDSLEKLGLDLSKIEDSRFKKDYWVSRPVWFWKELSDFQKIVEVSEPWKREKVPYVFCEDGSKFHKIENCKEFVAEMESPYDHRYARDFSDHGIEYRPMVRLYLENYESK